MGGASCTFRLTRSPDFLGAEYGGLHASRYAGGHCCGARAGVVGQGCDSQPGRDSRALALESQESSSEPSSAQAGSQRSIGKVSPRRTVTGDSSMRLRSVRPSVSVGVARPFDRLGARVMTHEPYRSARRVFWVVDNGSFHRGERARARLRATWPRLVLVQREVLTPNDFTSGSVDLHPPGPRRAPGEARGQGSLGRGSCPLSSPPARTRCPGRHA